MYPDRLRCPFAISEEGLSLVRFLSVSGHLYLVTHIHSIILKSPTDPSTMTHDASFALSHSPPPLLYYRSRPRSRPLIKISPPLHRSDAEVQPSPMKDLPPLPLPPSSSLDLDKSCSMLADVWKATFQRMPESVCSRLKESPIPAIFMIEDGDRPTTPPAPILLQLKNECIACLSPTASEMSCF